MKTDFQGVYIRNQSELASFQFGGKVEYISKIDCMLRSFSYVIGLGDNIFCMSWKNFHLPIIGYYKNNAGKSLQMLEITIRGDINIFYSCKSLCTQEVTFP